MISFVQRGSTEQHRDAGTRCIIVEAVEQADPADDEAHAPLLRQPSACEVEF